MPLPIYIKKASINNLISRVKLIPSSKTIFYHHHHHHHVVLVARISLTISRHLSLSFIASGRSSGQHPVSLRNKKQQLSSVMGFLITLLMNKLNIQLEMLANKINTSTLYPMNKHLSNFFHRDQIHCNYKLDENILKIDSKKHTPHLS